MMDELLEKVPEIAQYFMREGAVHEIHRLASEEFRNSFQGETDSNHREIKSWIHTQAQALQQKYFPDQARMTTELHSSAELLTLSLELEKLESPSAATQKEGLQALASMIQSKENGISTFEFLRSGTTQALCTYLIDHSGRSTFLLSSLTNRA